MTELYEENLRTLIEVMNSLEEVTKIDGLFEVEIRVRVDDVQTWAVVGFGESGDPCVLRFEEDKQPPSVSTTLPGWTTNTSHTVLRSLE